MLREELIRHPMDEDGVRKRLDSLQATPASMEALVEAVRDLLLQCQCRYCGQSLQAGQKRIAKAGYFLHEACSQKLQTQLQEMQRLQAPKANLDAYLDLLQVPHDVRDGMKVLLAQV
jgi:septation ring formation regulator EzrA